MDDRDGWGERVREICAGGATWWWWWWYINTSRWTHTNVCVHISIYTHMHIFTYLSVQAGCNTRLIQQVWIQSFFSKTGCYTKVWNQSALLFTHSWRCWCYVKCKQPGFELMSPCSFLLTIFITAQTPIYEEKVCIYIYIYIYIWKTGNKSDSMKMFKHKKKNTRFLEDDLINSLNYLVMLNVLVFKPSSGHANV